MKKIFKKKIILLWTNSTLYIYIYIYVFKNSVYSSELYFAKYVFAQPLCYAAQAAGAVEYTDYLSTEG